MFNFFWAQNIICSALFLGVAIAAVVQLAMLDERRRKLKKNNYVSALGIAFITIFIAKFY
jgi:hypothetical protein